MKVEFLLLARRELMRAAARYERDYPGRGDRFLEESACSSAGFAIVPADTKLSDVLFGEHSFAAFRTA